jgi:hypothetical protein
LEGWKGFGGCKQGNRVGLLGFVPDGMLEGQSRMGLAGVFLLALRCAALMLGPHYTSNFLWLYDDTPLSQTPFLISGFYNKQGCGKISRYRLIELQVSGGYQGSGKRRRLSVDS